MNLTEALNSALPEIPVLKHEFRPKVHPHLIGKERLERGIPLVTCLIPEVGTIYRLSPEQWALVNRFDGQRSLQEISDLHWEETGVRYSVDELKEIVATLDETNFWYKTPLDQNIALKERLADERQRRARTRSKYGDVSDLRLWYWNPDKYLDKAYAKLKFLYTPWFTGVSLLLLAFTVYVFFDRWSQIGNDTLQFYNFHEKSFRDIAEFWLFACGTLFVHETAHGITCKHYGGHVYKMGFNLIYLTPAFYTEAQEIFVHGGKWERISTVFWGVWSELLLCFGATIIWWGTPAGGTAHELMYKIMLITGLGAVLFNWNPLIKLDGYYLLTELLALPSLKEESTAYISAWVRKNIWGLPVEVPFVPQGRRSGYMVYAMLSGAYSYTLLFYATRFVSNIASSYSPDWGFLVGLAVGYRVFRARILKFLQFTKTLYLDKKERVLAWLGPQRRIVLAVILLLVLVLPIWHDSVEGRFALEPANRALIHATVPGMVGSVDVEEGQKVEAGAPLFRLRNLQLESKAAKTLADYRVAEGRASEARLQYAGFGPAENERQSLADINRTLQDQVARLDVKSPIAGTITTPRVRDRLGSYLEAGNLLAEVADLSTMRARIFLPEYQVRKADLNAPVDLLLDSSFRSLHGTVASRAPVSSSIEPGLMEKSAYRGAQVQTFYAYEILVSNPGGDLRSGMTGTAKIYGRRRTLLGLLWEPVADFVSRKVW